ncbi:hypothetical protein QQ008_07660 [Fulvivirgaceae bacterium BMA10]|uniref:Uncharacterized protein n=2 Tax=Splendidivirga corallicola TaxID=3051826 RepID=A0ABT8KKJ6_9BACT|nr:hypothetical protein [Fulvivirgaceae bacterium BMA10]
MVHDEFLGLGKKARRKRKARRARRKERRSVRHQRRRLKNDDRRADIEAKRAQTAIMKATMLETPTQNTSGAAPIQAPVQNAASKSSASAIAAKQAGVPITQKAGFGGNTLFIVVGVLIVGGYLYMSNKQQQYNPNTIPPTSQ